MISCSTVHTLGASVLVGLVCLACSANPDDTATGTRPETPAPTRVETAATLEPSPRARTGLELLVEPFTDFYFLMRAQAARVVEPEAHLQPIIDAWMPVQNEIGTFGGFWRFDLAGLTARSPSDFGRWFSDFPETVPSRAGGTIPIRGPGVAMAEAMKTPWPRFQDEIWPARQGQLEAVLERLEREFMPNHRRALRHMLDSLGIADPGIVVPTHLVLETHPPGASTYRTIDGPIAVLSTRELLSEGRFSDLEETILHETCHALDLAAEGNDDVFSVLRQMLSARGVGDRDRRLHDIPHLVMFAQAENTMRRLYNPDHVAYGDTWRGDIAPLYERSGEAAVVVREVWSQYLDGKLSRDDALAKIVTDLVPG